MIHLIMPFSRHHLWGKLIEAYRPMNVILHPLLLGDESPPEYSEGWIHPFVDLEMEGFNQSALLNSFIQNGPIIDDDYYVTVSDDDMYEPGVIDAIRKMNDPVVVISMKRGHRIPKGVSPEKAYPDTTLIAAPGNVEIGSIGGEQVFIKGWVLKALRFNEDHPAIADGLLAVQLKAVYPIKYRPDLFALFNFYEPGRWDTGPTFAFGTMINDLVRFDMCMRQSEIEGQMHFVKNPESATKGLNILLDMIEADGADVAVLAHQDMFFRQGWIPQAKEQIAKLPEGWTVAGVIGKDMHGRVCGRLHDMRIPLQFNTEKIHTFPHEACCFDECVILVNLKSGFRFDETLDGFDLYGTLCVLQTWEAGGEAWIIDAFCEHYCMRPFTWFPDEKFQKNYQYLYDRFNELGRIDTTVIGYDEREPRFETSAAPEKQAA
jgi:hypothetical protein